MNFTNQYKFCPVLQIYIPNSDLYNEFLKISFESSYLSMFRLITDSRSRYFFCKASELKEHYPKAFLVSIITNPYNRMFRHYKEYQKTYGSELTFTKFIKEQEQNRTLFDCSDYIDIDINFIIRSENFQNDFIKFLKLINLDNIALKLPTIQPMLYPNFYTSETKEIIKNLFKKDFDQYYRDFNYYA